jgi:hypothetical protein
MQFWVGPGKNRLFRNFSFIKFAYLFKMINHTNFSDCLCLIYVSCVCLRIVASNTYCVVFACFVCLRLALIGTDCTGSGNPTTI